MLVITGCSRGRKEIDACNQEETVMKKEFKAATAICGAGAVSTGLNILARKIVQDGVIDLIWGDMKMELSLSWHAVIARTVIIWLVLTFLALHFVVGPKELYNFLFRYRFAVGAGFILIGTLLNLNGSSVAAWSAYTGQKGGELDMVFGTFRTVRSDEWAVLTPMTISQAFGDSYSWFSSIIRGTSTDVFVVYALPVRTLWMIFRPFYVGFLFLGTERGLAFFWCARLVCLFLTSFEFFRFLTKDNRKLSLAGAFLTAFSPLVHWWFAVNGLVELLIFGFLFILMLDRFLKTEKFFERILPLILMYISGGAYIMTLYPPWMVPLGYIFLVFTIFVFVKNGKEHPFTIRKFLGMAGALVFLAVSLILIFRKSWDAVELTMGTVYPGMRSSVGGKEAPLVFFRSISNIFYPYINTGLTGAECEYATFYDFFPLGIFLGTFVLIQKKGKDLLIWLLFATQLLLAVFAYKGFPEILAKITLLSHSTSNRSLIAFALINVILLLYSVNELKTSRNLLTAVELSIVVTLLASIFSYRALHENYDWYLTDNMAVVEAVVLFAGCMLMCRFKRKYTGTAACVFIAVLSFASAATVNPIQIGIANLYESDVAKMIYDIVEQDPDGLWIVDSPDYPCINFPMMEGARTVNSTNVYPELERWEMLDPDGKYEEIYNRYAHVNIDLVNGGSETVFTKLGEDNILITMPSDALKQFGVSYVLTDRDLGKLNDPSVQYELVTEVPNRYVYRVKSR